MTRTPLLPRLVIAVLLVPALLAGCASGGTRTKVVTTYQAVEVGLGAVQDAEMELFKAGLITKEKHVEINEVFVRAFDAQIKFGNALLVWRPQGETAIPPQGYAAWLSTVETALKVLETLPTQNAELVSRVRVWVARVVEIIKELNQPVPPILTAALTVK